MSDQRRRIIWSAVLLFAVAMAYFEAAIVVYLRELFYPGGFSFPLILIPTRLVLIELGRELASLVMLAAVAVIAGRNRWERFGYFLVTFGVWDIFYYVFLKVTIDWPASLLDWDILFLIPLPWIGPVIAPCLVALEMIVAGALIVRLYRQARQFRPGWPSWALGSAATASVLYSFMRDTAAGLHRQMPRPYGYAYLIAGMLLYAVAFYLVMRRSGWRST